ncbi:hypothetical protein [Oceanobacillus oncorhynchi]|uniref:hypothetical protein n=1 Tax=Oceanobacillus oncorhynchi TaxID=545501 RepID=UPI0034D4D5E3
MIEKILFHNVQYWFEENKAKQLSDIDIEYIKEMINNGYSSGQLVSYDSETDKESYGWWQIEGYETQEYPK